MAGLISLIWMYVTAVLSGESYHGPIKIGVILPYQPNFPWAIPFVEPAIAYAVEGIRNGTGSPILVGREIEVHTGDSQCSETQGPLVAIDMYIERQAHVFLGPVCDYSVAPIARFSPHWNIPVITAGAMVQAFSDKTQYRLLTRIAGSYVQLGDCLVDIFSHFGWVVPGLIYNQNSGPRTVLGKTDCFFVMEGIYHAMQRHLARHFPNHTDIWYKGFDERSENAFDQLEVLLRDASLNSRSKECFWE